MILNKHQINSYLYRLNYDVEIIKISFYYNVIIDKQKLKTLF